MPNSILQSHTVWANTFCHVTLPAPHITQCIMFVTVFSLTGYMQYGHKYLQVVSIHGRFPSLHERTVYWTLVTYRLA